MNRTIKFRGKRLDNGEWVHGSFRYIDGEHFITTQERPFVEHEIDPNTLGQFTGLYDKNGKEIYERDILHLWTDGITNRPFDDFKAEVLFNKGMFKVGGRTVFQASTLYNYKFDVIGNIHNNPELLKL